MARVDATRYVSVHLAASLSTMILDTKTRASIIALFVFPLTAAGAGPPSLYIDLIWQQRPRARPLVGGNAGGGEVDRAAYATGGLDHDGGSIISPSFPRRPSEFGLEEVRLSVESNDSVHK
ncbi:hypothetical protein F4818DRAFT_439554 [Hypoxylon cercidicola]|nr:hypothetical protein F4818DRAFT_439554 [Hypoxylon cercidicola]